MNALIRPITKKKKPTDSDLLKETRNNNDVVFYVELNGEYTPRLTLNLKLIRESPQRVKKEVIDQIRTAAEWLEKDIDAPE